MSTYKILIVDDFMIIRETLPKILAKFGFESVAVSSGFEALAYLRENSVDLVISDISMPGMTGLDLLDSIKAEYDDLPVVLMSGDIHHQNSPRLQNAEAFLAKPFFIDDMLQKIKNRH